MPQNIDTNKLIKYGGYAILALVVIIVIVAAIKIVKGFLGNELTQAQQEHINSLEIDEKEVSVPKTEIQNLVAKLKAAFGSYGWGTDEDAVYDVFEALNSRSDVLSLINAFGVYEDHTLPEWMNKELNRSELEHVQQILSSKGIVYQF